MIPDAPDVSALNPQMMTAAELQNSLEAVFNWLHIVEALPDAGAAVDELTVESIRDAANMLLEEQRDRHADESAPRGG